MEVRGLNDVIYIDKDNSGGPHAEVGKYEVSSVSDLVGHLSGIDCGSNASGKTV